MGYTIIVVGCGGTGANYIVELGRYLYQNTLASSCSLLLIDGDVVEEDNISRQPFSPVDIGRKKVEVMAEILQQAFGISSSYYPEYLLSHNELNALVGEETKAIIIGAVDNHACRKVLHKYFLMNDNCVYIDAANEYSAGEVVFGVKVGGRILAHDRTYYYPEILADISVPKTEERCLVVNTREPQHLITNLFAALLLLKCTVEVITDNGWAGGIYYFDAFKGFSRFEEEKI